MKPSRYNFVFPYQFNKSYSVVYNTFLDTVGIVTAREAEFIKTCDKSLGIHETKVESFKKKGFIIEPNTDELAALKVDYLKSKYDPQLLSLVIVPTYQCNLDCGNCYEKLSYSTADNTIMPLSVQDSIIKWLNNNLDGVKKIEVSWHGGEPLVAMEVVRKLSSEIQRLAKSLNIEYIGKMSTNGYLFTEEVAKELSELGIREYKMSIDGCRDNHDTKKRHKDGGPTYDVIMDNLDKTREFYDLIDLRINVDKKDLEDAYEIKNILKGKKLCSKIKPRLGKPCHFSLEKNDDNFTKEEYVCEAINYSLMHGIGPNEFSRKDCFCIIEKLNSYIIDSHGVVFKCVADTGDGQSSGKLLEDGTIKLNKNFYETAITNPTTSILCEKCTFLPICFGECAYERKIGKPCSFGSMEEECWIRFLNAYVIKRLLNRLHADGFTPYYSKTLSLDDLIMGELGDQMDDFIDKVSSIETVGNIIAMGERYGISLSNEDAELLIQLMQPTELAM